MQALRRIPWPVTAVSPAASRPDLSPDPLQSAPHTPWPRGSCLLSLFPLFSEPSCPGSHTSQTQPQKHGEFQEDTRCPAPSPPLGNRMAPTMLLTQHRCAHVCTTQPWQLSPGATRPASQHMSPVPEARVGRCGSSGSLSTWLVDGYLHVCWCSSLRVSVSRFPLVRTPVRGDQADDLI